MPNFCIRRPAFTIVISLVMTIVGLIGFINLPLRWIPNVTPPQISIYTEYTGASARLIEHDVTKVIEGGLSGISGLETLTSSSHRNNSRISLTFRLGTNMNVAVEDVRTAVERVKGELPKDVEAPIVTKADIDSQPIMYLSFSDSKWSPMELSDYVDKYIVPLIETIDGVGTVKVFGKRVSAMHINLNPAKMAAANVTADEVAQIVRDHSASVPSGLIRGRDRFYSVVTDNALKTRDDFNDLIIRADANKVVHIKDIGQAQFEPEENDTSFRVSGKAAIALGIIPQSTANPLEVEARIQKVFNDVKRTLPTSMQAGIAYNLADYIRASIHSVYESFFEAIFFVWIVIFIFLCSFRASIVPIITIPVCLVSTFALLYVLGFSINTITLMAFVLAIGLVVDDAIVMLENISRHIENGLTPFQAALTGSREIIFPIIAMTLTLVAVYAPIAFTPGLLGVLFREFTFSLAGAVLISGIVALTLSPMMCAKILKPTDDSRYREWFTEKMHKLQYAYQTLLMWVVEKRKWVVAALLSVGLAGIVVHQFVPSELTPQEDMGQIYVSVSGPRNASYAYTEYFSKELEPIYKNYADIDEYISILFSPSHAFHILNLKPKKDRKLSTDALITELSNKTSHVAGVRINVFPPSPPLAELAGSDDGGTLGVVLKTAGDYTKLQRASQKILNELKKTPGFLYVDNNLKWDNEQFKLNLDNDRAADLKVPISSITNTVSTMLAGRIVGKTDDANIILKMRDADLSDPEIIQQMYVRNHSGLMIPLSNIVTLKEMTAPEVFRHNDRLRADNIFARLSPELKLGEAINLIKNIAQSVLPDDIQYSFLGEAKSFLESKGKTIFTFALALIFIYLVLVAQFESFIDPLIILFTVPFALVGAVLTLKVFGGSMNIYSNIGLITLIGLISKHGILITEFANRLRQEGKSIKDAAIQSALLRLRPILMTTAAMVLGAIPLAFAMGPGAESRQQVGLVIAGGMMFGTFFSLIVVPIAYTYLAPFRKLQTAEDL